MDSCTGVGVPRPVAEGGGQSGAAALVVVRVLARVDGRVDTDSPHARSVSVVPALM